MSREIDVPSEPERSPMPLLLQCRHCAMIPYPGDRFCACCGGRLTQSCRRCGSHRMHPVANYCTQCGVALEESEKIGPVTIPAADDSSGRRALERAGERPGA